MIVRCRGSEHLAHLSRTFHKYAARVRHPLIPHVWRSTRGPLPSEHASRFTRRTADAPEEGQSADSRAAPGPIAGRAASVARLASSIPDRACPRAQAVIAPAPFDGGKCLRRGALAIPLGDLPSKDQQRTQGGSGGREVWLHERATPNRDRSSAKRPTAAPH